MKKDNAIAWLNSLEITNYEIIESPKYEFVINVNTNVDLNSKGLKTIEYKFGIIKGFFNCNYNLLESLENAPDIVQGNFSCGTNMLNSLLGLLNKLMDTLTAQIIKFKICSIAPVL